MGFDDRTDFIKHLAQAQMEVFVGEKIDRGVKNMSRLAIRRNVDDADAGALAARVNAKNAGHHAHSLDGLRESIMQSVSHACMDRAFVRPETS